MHPFNATRAILFDLDGTLLDSYPTHLLAYRVMFERLGVTVDDETFRAVYSPNWLESYRAMGIPPERWAEADAIWMEEAARHTPDLFPTAKAVLARLGRTYQLGLVTAGHRSRVMRDLENTGILDRFQVIITAEDVRVPKPHPHGLELALAALVPSRGRRKGMPALNAPGLPPEQALYVGDTRADYEMAQAAGMPFIGIPSQFPGLTAQLGCRLVGSLEELADLLG